MFNGIYELIAQTVFNSTTLSGYPDLVVTLFSTFAVLFLISIPFIIVYKFITIILGR